MTTFEEVRPVADAVLYEGYVLYPYRADDPKNRVRFQWGVLVPPAYAATDPSERSAMTAQLLVEGRSPSVEVRLRFLHVQRRTVQRRDGDAMTQVSELVAGDAAYLPFDEAVEREVAVEADLATLCSAPVVHDFDVDGSVDVEPVPGGQLTRVRLPLTGSIRLAAERLPGPYGVVRLRITVSNNAVGGLPDKREEALRSSLVAAHVLVRCEGGAFLSPTDPPEWAREYAAESPSEGVWPVLVGGVGARDLVLCSPIILPDHPQVAPESATAFYDATEVDELLSLRTLTLTDSEKRAVRGTDPRAAGLLDDVEGLPADVMDRLHGAVRYLSQTPRRVSSAESADRPEPAVGQAADPSDDSLDVAGVAVGAGSRVLLRPGTRRADAQDIFLAGRTALVKRVMHDVDGGDHLAVVLDDDEGMDVALAHGRFLFFAPDEVEPLEVVR